MTTTATTTATSPFPAADVVLPVDAPRDEWLEVRRTGIGSSDVSAIMGLSPYKSQWSIYVAKVDGVEEPAGEQAMWGRRHEPTIADVWSERTGIDVRRVGIARSREHPWMLASCDRITSDGGILEIKNVSEYLEWQWWDGHEEQVPDHAEIQVTHQMMVTGLRHAYVAGHIGGNRLLERRVDYDPELAAVIHRAEAAFWARVTERRPPLAEACDADLMTRARRPSGAAIQVDPAVVTPLVVELAAARAAVKRAEEAELAAKVRLRQIVGDAEHAMVGDREVYRVARRTRTGLDTTRLRADHADLAAEYETTSEFDVVTTPRGMGR